MFLLDQIYLDIKNPKKKCSRPQFVGYTNHEISFSESSLTWELVHVTTRESLASYNGSKLWPTGRNTWHVSRGVCGNFDFDQDLILSRYTRIISAHDR